MPEVSKQPWQAAGLTDVGRVRESNQDAFALLEARHCSLVADGMGGHPGGDVASRVAIDAISSSIEAHVEPPEGPPGNADRQIREAVLLTAIQRGHLAVRREAERHPFLAGMGTTVVALWVHHTPRLEATVAHVGDSRAYLFRRSVLTPLTQDHSVVEEYRRQGLLSAEQMQAHPLRHVLSRAVGPDPEVAPDARTVALEPDDLLLLCTDGLTKMLSDPEIGAILGRVTDVRTGCTSLVAAANKRGGEDNVTVVLIRVGPDQRKSV